MKKETNSYYDRQARRGFQSIPYLVGLLLICVVGLGVQALVNYLTSR